MTQNRGLHFRLWPIVGASFALLLALVTLFAWSFARKASAIDERAAFAHSQYQAADDAITNIRSDVYRAALLAHDKSFEQRDSALRRELASLRNASEAEVKRLDALLSRTQEGSLSSLRRLLEGYWNALEVPRNRLEDFPAVGGGERRGELRDAVLTIDEQMDALNEASIQEQESEITANRDALRRFALKATGALVSLSLCVALASIYYLARLERRSERERSRAEGAEIELRRLSRQLVKAQEEERKNISRELHDEVGQILTGLRMELGAITPKSEGGAFEERLNSVKGLAEDALRTVRNLALLLRPSMLDDLGLGPALQWQAKEVSRRLGIPIGVKIEGNLSSLSEPQRICLYRVVQEALTNSARHARASQISIRIVQNDGAVEATIADDGEGFDRKARRQGLGLTGMEERVKTLRGTLKIRSENGKGTELRAILPLEAEAASPVKL